MQGGIFVYQNGHHICRDMVYNDSRKNKGVIFMLLIGLWIFWIIALLVFYHKVFSVYYFNLTKGCLQEILTAGLLGMVLAYLTIKLWWVTAIILVLAGLSASAKADNKAPLAAAVVLAVIIAIVGINLKSNSEDTRSSANAARAVIVYMEGKRV